MKPDFKNIDIYNPGIEERDPKTWEKAKGIQKNKKNTRRH